MKKLYFLFSLVFIFSCSNKVQINKDFIELLKEKKEVYEIIKSFTQRPIYLNEPVYIEFLYPVIDKKDIGKEINSDIVVSNEGSFKVFWETDSKLVIRHNLEPGDHSITIKFEKLFSGLKDLRIDLKVLPIEVSVEPYIEYKSKDELSYNFKIYTKMDEKELKKNIRLLIDGKDFGFKIENNKDNFLVSTDFMKRDKIRKKVLLSIDKTGYSKKFIVPSLNEIEIIDFKIENEVDPNIVLSFSEPLDESQDIRGLVRVEPFKDIKLKKIRDKVYVKGLERGKKYSLVVEGIKGKYSGFLPRIITKDVDIQEEKPKIEFVSDGMFLTSVNDYRVRFKTINLKAVNVRVVKVFSNNLTEFLHDDSVDASRKRSKTFSEYIDRVGIDIYNSKVNLKNYEKNKWIINEIDLKESIKKDSKGIYLINISANTEDYDYIKKEDSSENSDEYYERPYDWSYIYRNLMKFKPVIKSDIGILVKEISDGYIVFTNDIKTTEPLEGVELTIMSYQNQVIDKKISSKDGTFFKVSDKSNVYYLLADREKERSFILINPLNSRETPRWSKDEFDTAGVDVDDSEIKAFIYTERGVYRPGDEINISVIARDKTNSFKEDHPVKLEFYNPESKLLTTIVNNNAKDGFYSFNLKTSEKDITGTYIARLYVGPRTFNYPIRIEAIVPYRIKVSLIPSSKEFFSKNISLSISGVANYLFGTPAANMNYEIERIVNQDKIKTSFNNYYFDNETLDFSFQTENISEGQTDDSGKISIKDSFDLPADSPTFINVTYRAKVYEESGRPVYASTSVNVYPYEKIIGLKIPPSDYGYLEVGKDYKFSVVLLKKDKTISNQKLDYKIYRVKSYWWWDYPSYHEFKRKFKISKNLEVVKSGEIVTKTTPVDIEFTPDDWGYYLIEITGDDNTSVCAKFFNVFYWGSNFQSPRSASILLLNSDKPYYSVGDTAKISFVTPSSGHALITVEKRDKIIKTMWEKINKDKMTVEIPIEKSMEPNVYLSVALIQDYKVTLNDRPMRMYGIIPIVLKLKNSRQEIEIKAPDTIKPNEDFEINIQTKDNKKTQFTISVVDEGILAITDFKTPDPESYFYAKERYMINTYDIYDLVMDMIKGVAHNRVAIGGGSYMYKTNDLEKLLPSSPEKKRFISVSMFKGPMYTDEKGFASVRFKMIDYIGAVRVMVVAARGNTYGSSEKIISVKSDIMASVSLPRFLRPGDEVIIPINVFVNDKSIKTVDLDVDIDDFIEINDKKVKLNFDVPGSKITYFKLKAKNSVGIATIKVSAKGGGKEHSTTSYIEVQPVKRFLYEKEIIQTSPGSTNTIKLKNHGLKGSNLNTITIFPFKPLNIKDRIEFLINYPYGCIEQTVSSVFPQLYLKKIFMNERFKKVDDIDKNIVAGIQKVIKFQTADGGFSYWPSEQPDPWSTNYAGHFLIEAKNLGYDVPDHVINNWLDFQTQKANEARDDIKTRVYRLYLLALANKPQLPAMNLILEQFKANKLKLDTSNKLLLAAAYFSIGQEDVVNLLTKSLDFSDSSEKYSYDIYTYGSWLRDKGIILDALVALKNTYTASRIFNEIVDELNSKNWYSTQTIGYCLLAVGKYLDAVRNKKDNNLIDGYIKIDNDTIPIQSTDIITLINIDPKYYGKNASIFISPKTTYQSVFISSFWQGIPLINIKNYSSKVSHDVYFYNTKKDVVDTLALKQGDTIFAVITVTNKTGNYVNNMALEFNLPSCFEIENIRLVGGDLPNWISSGFNIKEPRYLDIRDDRSVLFFDLSPKEKVSFVLKINVVFKGVFGFPSSVLEAMYDNSYYSVNSIHLKARVE